MSNDNNEMNDDSVASATDAAEHHPAPDINPPAARRQRMIQMPVDRSLLGELVMKTQEIYVRDLLDEDVEMEMNLNKSHLNLQIMRIITPQSGNTGNQAMTRYQHRLNSQQRITFIRIILCRNEKQLCYVMMTSEMNKRLYHRDLLLRDNGVLTVGSYFRFLAPLPVERNMQGIPLVNSYYPALAMQQPNIVHSIPINSYIEGNQAQCAFLKNVFVSIRRTTAVQTTCSGKHCDKQRPTDWAFTTTRACGCWGTTSLGTSNIALMHNVIVQNGMNENEATMKNFSSTNFNSLVMDKPIPPNTKVTALEQTTASERLNEAIENCVEFINENGGFQVLLWYSRGEINDQSLIGLNAQDNAQVDSGRITYHIVSIQPMDTDLLDIRKEAGQLLHHLKFSVGQNL